MPSLILSGQVHGPAAGALRQAPQLGDRHADRVEELEHGERRRRRADVDGLELVEAELLAQLRQHQLVRLRVLLGQLRPGPARRPARARTFWWPTSRAHFSARLALLVLLGLDHRLEARLQLLPDARDGEEPARPHLGQVGDHLARVRAARDGVAEHDRHVVAGGALGDVRHRQVGDDPRALGEVDHVVERLHREHHVVVRELDALRRPGRAGGVDQREQVVRLDRRALAVDLGRGRPRVASRSSNGIASSPAGGVDQDHVPHARRLRARRAARCSRNAGSVTTISAPGVVQLVGDLVGRERLVERERRRAEAHRGRVGDVELGPVGRASGRSRRRASGRAPAGRARSGRPARRTRPSVISRSPPRVRSATRSGFSRAV